MSDGFTDMLDQDITALRKRAEAAEANLAEERQSRKAADHREHDLQVDIGNLNGELIREHTALAEVLAREAVKESALRSIEWHMRGAECPYCGECDRFGHLDDCIIGNALTVQPATATLLLALARAAVAESKAENRRHDYPSEVGRTMEAKANRRAAADATLSDPLLVAILKEATE